MPVKMWNKVTASIPANTANQAVAHGLGVVPTVIFLGFGCGADITIGATAATATNIYISNGHATNAQNVVALVFAPHSLIDG